MVEVKQMAGVTHSDEMLNTKEWNNSQDTPWYLHGQGFIYQQRLYASSNSGRLWFVIIVAIYPGFLPLLRSYAHHSVVGKRNSSDKLTPNASAIAAIFLNDGFLSPRSMPPR